MSHKAMTVKELIEELQRYDPELPVHFADGECDSVDTTTYRPTQFVTFAAIKVCTIYMGTRDIPEYQIACEHGDENETDPWFEAIIISAQPVEH
jgi:hypothetical protein